MVIKGQLYTYVLVFECPMKVKWFLCYRLWQSWLWSFQDRDTKLECTQSKSLNLRIDIVGRSQEVPKFAFRSQFLTSKIIRIFLIFFYWAYFLLKFLFSIKNTSKIDEIFTEHLTLCSKCQIDSEDYVIFCGLLRKHELYWHFLIVCINFWITLFSKMMPNFWQLATTPILKIQ